VNESSFEAMAEEIDGLLGIDPNIHEDWHTETQLVWGYNSGDERTGAVSSPIYPSSTFAHPAYGQSTGYCYGRCGNPTRLELENTIAMLEGGIKALAVSSGMGAIASVLKLFSSGDHILLCDDLYGGTYRLVSELYNRYGIESSYVDPTNLEAVKAAIQPNTRALFVETPTNPTMKVVDIAAVAEIAHSSGAILVVDNTLLTPYFQRPFEFGADLIVHSGTKYLCGHNDVLAGFIVLKDNTYLEPLFNAVMSEGNVLSPMDSWLMLRSLKTLAVRLRAQEANAKALCDLLKQHPHVTDVYYAGDPDSAGYELMKRQTKGFGAMISFRVDKPERVPDVLERVRLIRYAESLGGVESLITYPLVQTHGSMPAPMRKALGIDNRLLRLSVGIEDVHDLLSDLDQALSGCIGFQRLLSAKLGKGFC
jgi:cystathionine gamma-synthase